MSNFEHLETTMENKGRGFTQLVRYGIIGVLSNAVGYLFYLLVTTIWVGPKMAMSSLYGIGVLVSFLGNRHWTFGHDGKFTGSFIRFCIAHLFGYFLNLSLLMVFVDVFGYPHQWVQLVSIFVVAGFLFAMFRFFVFSHRDTKLREIP